MPAPAMPALYARSLRPRPRRRRRAGSLALGAALALLAAATTTPRAAASDLAVAVAAKAGALPPAGRLRITGLPLGGRGFVDLEVERFDLLAPDLRYVRDGERVPAPAFVRGLGVYRGEIAGEPGSRVVLLRTADGRLAGEAEHDGLSYELATDRGALLAQSGTEQPQSLEGCRVLRPERVRPGPSARVASAGRAGKPRRRPPVAIPADLYGAPVLLDVHYELWQRFLGDEQRIVEELVRTFALVSDRFEEGIAVRLQVAGISLLTRPDPPWSWEDFVAGRPVDEAPRALVYMVNDGADRVDGGGSLAGLCTAYGPGDFKPGPARDYGWSWLAAGTIAHEIGHVFGSDHTHCYGYSGEVYGDGFDSVLARGAPGEPPVDKCWGRDPFCYVGPPELLPGGEGSIMSYCRAPSRHFGARGRHGTHSERVPAIMRATVERAAARYPSCLQVLTDAVGLRLDDRQPGTARLAWNDIFQSEAAWLLETRKAGGWRTARKLPPNTTSVTLSRAQSKPGATYRLRARLGGRVSEPSTAVTLP